MKFTRTSSLAPLIIGIFLLGILCAVLLSPQPTVAGLAHNISGWAWSETIGWISFNSFTGGGNVDYGVNVNLVTGTISGYAWNGSVGWISFNETVGCPLLPCQPKLDLETNVVTGWAKILSTNTWIALKSPIGSPVSYGVTRSGFDFQGYGWDDTEIGWVSFNCAQGGSSGTNICGLSNYKVTMAPAIPQCADGVDNADPEDTLADINDPGCHSDGNASNILSYVPTDVDEENALPVTECRDGVDNADPEDSLADFPADPGCLNADDNDEIDPPVEPEGGPSTPTVDIKARRGTATGAYSNGPIVISAGQTIDLSWETDWGVTTVCTVSPLVLPLSSGTMRNGTKNNVAVSHSSTYTYTCVKNGITKSDTVRIVVAEFEEF